MIIAVDGPTASGKGTIAKALAEHYGLPHLDTGLLYRAVGFHTITMGGNPDKEGDALAACGFPDHLLLDSELRSEASGGLASRVSVHPQVRQELFDHQRTFATQDGGAVLDGRDIGTVIAPDADIKLFVTASTEERAARRFAEMRDAGRDVSLDAILADLEARDERDRGRDAAPLVQADDAFVLDTSEMGRQDAIDMAIAYVRNQIDRRA